MFSSFRGSRLAPLAAAAATGRAAAAARRTLAGRAYATVAAPATEQETMVAQPHKEYFRKVGAGLTRCPNCACWSQQLRVVGWLVGWLVGWCGKVAAPVGVGRGTGLLV